MGALDIINTVTASISTTGIFDIACIDRVTQAVRKAGQQHAYQEPVDADALLAKALRVSVTDIAGLGMVADAVSGWISAGLAATAANTLEGVSYNALFMSKGLLAPHTEKELYWQVRDADKTLIGRRALGAAVHRIRKNKFMNWSYDIEVCQWLVDKDARAGVKSCIVRCVTPQLCFVSNRLETQTRLQLFCTALDDLETAVINNGAVWPTTHTMYDRSVTLLMLLRQFAREREVLTLGEHDAVCRVVYAP